MARGAAPDSRFRDFLAGGGSGAPFADQWAFFEALDGARGPADPPPAAWLPGPAERRDSNIGRLAASLGLSSMAELHAWSVREKAAFWGRVVGDLGVLFARPPRRVFDPSDPERPRWLEGGLLNIADTCLAGKAGSTAILSGREGSREVRRTTLGDLESLANRVGRGLRDSGLEPGDGVALYMPMTPECVAAYIGIVRAGLVAVSVADSFPAPEIARRLAIAGAKAVVCGEAFLRGGKRIDLYARVREAGAPPAVVIPSGDATPPLRPGDRTWADLLGADDAPLSEERAPSDPTNVLFSSGTTGTPKAIPWTHLTPLKAAMDGRFHHDIRPGDVVAWPTNIGWMMGPWLIYASLLNGASMALHEGNPGSADFRRFVGDAGVTMLGVVPSLVRAWRAAGPAEDVDWSRLRVLSSTGEASSREDYLWLMAEAGYRAPVIEYCGGTEIGGGYVTGSLLQPASPATFTTPALGLEMLLLDGAGRPAAEGDAGEVFLLPPSIGLSEDLLNADHHAVYHGGCPPGPGGAPLRRHGDAMVRLPGGSLRARGRSDDTMNLGGIKVSSLEVEEAAARHPAVAECAAVGVQEGGEGAERLLLFVVPRGEPDPATLREEVGRAIARELNPLFRVHELLLVESLPRTASQKVMRRLLRERHGR